MSEIQTRMKRFYEQAQTTAKINGKLTISEWNWYCGALHALSVVEVSPENFNLFDQYSQSLLDHVEFK